jgi:hypothetical protein
MAFDFDPLPADASSALLIARDQVVECVEEFTKNFRKGPTVGHAGKVTWKYLREQARMAPKSVITVITGRAERLGGGSQTLFTSTFIWFLVSHGRIQDRTNLGLLLVGEGARFVTDPPWMNLPGSAFAMTPVAESIEFKALYEDEDEKNGLSVWALQWRQAVDLTTARRPPLVPRDPLQMLGGVGTVAGSPNDDQFTTESDLTP